jgi:hypothetical protein
MAKFTKAIDCYHREETFGWLNAVKVKAFIHPDRDEPTRFSYHVIASVGGQTQWSVCTIKRVPLATAKSRVATIMKSHLKPTLVRGEF